MRNERLNRSRKCLDSGPEAARFFAPGFMGMRREALHIAYLDAERCLIGVRLHYSTRCDSIDLPIKRIIADALALDTHGLLIAHNHPGGDPSPSQSDLVATRLLANVMRPMEIALHDHLIFADEDWRSLRALGFM